MNRALSRAAVVVVVVLAAVFGGAGTASAHPTLLFTDPAADTAVPDSPQTITLVFNEPVTVGVHAIAVQDTAGLPVPTGATTTAQDGRIVTTHPAGRLSAGTYVVRWQATGTDGDQVDEEFRFAIGSAVAAAASNDGQSIAWLDAVLRWLLFAGFAMAVGSVFGEWLTATARGENPALARVRPWIGLGALGGVVAVAGLGVLLVVDTDTVTSLWQGRSGQLLLVEAAGFAAALGLTALHRPRWTILPLLAVAVAEGLRSHANTAQLGWGALLTGAHLAAVAAWAGTLLHVVRAALAWRQTRAAVRWLLSAYARLSLWMVVLVVATGSIATLLLVPLQRLLVTTYGQILLVKLGLVAVAVGIALTARRALRHRERLDRTVTVARVEIGVLAGVLAISAVLVSTPPVGSQPPTPPPARGPVLPLGTLAGQVGVSASVSDGQLVVRLSTPRRGDYYAATPDQDYTLSGQLTGAPPAAFTGCGAGCFVAPIDWRRGDNVLTLRAAASGWRGGTVSLLVPWPTQPGADDLARAVAAMRAADRVTVYESVTSDTTTPVPAPQQLVLTGPFFVSQEPYAAGNAPIAMRISPAGQPIRLALGYPAETTTVALTLDNQGRIGEETLTDGTHLIHRRFVYPSDQ